MIEDQYRARHPRLVKAAAAIEHQLREYLEGTPHVDRVSARAKSIDRFVAKAKKNDDNGFAKYSDPLSQIQDQVGARIIGFYLPDIEAISTVVKRYYRPIETKSLVPDSEWSFGYFGKHFILLMPTGLVDDCDEEPAPDFFELQIKTLFQHAWSEAEHDVGYKPGTNPLTSDEQRQLAFTAAQAWGADRIFEELSKR